MELRFKKHTTDDGRIVYKASISENEYKEFKKVISRAVKTIQEYSICRYYNNGQYIIEIYNYNRDITKDDLDNFIQKLRTAKKEIEKEEAIVYEI